MKRFFISSAIDYPSTPPHLGHLYEKVCVDVIARWHRLKGEKVHFSTGLDAHGSKIERYAREAKKTPAEFVRLMEPFFLRLCKEYNISYDDFIKTTERRHERVVVKIIEDLNKIGDIYKEKYSGYYCSDCETYFAPEELLDDTNCPTHNKPTEFLLEDSYFFKMSKYQDKLINHIKKHSNFIRPKEKRNEILNRLKVPLRDLSLTREKVKWGTSFPLDTNLVTAIWVEALINYLTTIDYSNQKYKEFWPALHIIGPDIVWHHSVIWSTILLALDIKLPEILVHGFIKSISGEKMSKSLGNVIDPLKLVKIYSSDAIRYHLIRSIPFGQDGDFSEEALKARINGELLADLGNLVSRVLTLVEKNRKVKLKGENELVKRLELKKIDNLMENFEISLALEEIWKFIRESNKYVNENEPWKLEGERLGEVLCNLVEAIRIISILISAFIPETAEKINKQLGIKRGDFKDLEFKAFRGKIKKGELLFKKV